MYQNILLTFDHIDGYCTYAWFETDDIIIRENRYSD